LKGPLPRGGASRHMRMHAFGPRGSQLVWLWCPWQQAGQKRISGLTFTPQPSSMSGTQLMVQLSCGAPVVKG